jgi:hypothetical protein
MAIVANYRSDIFELAADVTQTDEVFRRLLNFAHIQYTYCLWGMMPGTIKDETSPFNECAHAYLAATKAVLVHMRDMPGKTDAVGDLVSRIDLDMVRNGGSFVQCRYSGEPFNTAGLIRPRWSDIPLHFPSLAVLLSVLLLIAALLTALFRSPPGTRPAIRPRNAKPDKTGYR